MDELISVIIPVYGVERWLRPCIESVRNQTYRNLEILLIDDGSPDKCPEICDEYASKDTRIRVVHQKNGGISAARNAGLELASGMYIAFIDGDDQIEPQMLEQLYQALTEHHADMAVGRLLLVQEDGTVCESISPSREGKGDILTRLEALERLEEVDIAWTVFPNKLYRKNLWQEFRFPHGKWHEDEFMIHKLLYKCQTIVCVPDATYLYVQRKGSCMAELDVGKLLYRLEAHVDRLSFFLEEELHEFLFRQDRLSLWEIEQIHREKPDGGHKVRFRELMDQYASLHRQVVNTVEYPLLKKIQVVLYLWFYHF